jgi:hypothetical protein
MTACAPLHYIGGQRFVDPKGRHRTLRQMMAGCYAVAHENKRAASRCIGEHLHGSGFHGHLRGKRHKPRRKRASKKHPKRGGRRTRATPTVTDCPAQGPYDPSAGVVVLVTPADGMDALDYSEACSDEDCSGCEDAEADEEMLLETLAYVYGCMFCKEAHGCNSQSSCCVHCGEDSPAMHCRCGMYICDPSGPCFQKHTDICRDPEDPFEALDMSYNQFLNFHRIREQPHRQKERTSLSITM